MIHKTDIEKSYEILLNSLMLSLLKFVPYGIVHLICLFVLKFIKISKMLGELLPYSIKFWRQELLMNLAHTRITHAHTIMH